MVAIITSVIKEKGKIDMAKIVAGIIITAVIVLLSGCGYKAPPYYEKPVPAKESSVAL
jgi:hypothetical protein